MPIPPAPPKPDAQVGVSDHGRAQGLSFADRLLWICPIVGLIAITPLLWLLGLTLWTALGIAFLIVCPVVIAWVLLAERIGKSVPPRTGK